MHLAACPQDARLKVKTAFIWRPSIKPHSYFKNTVFCLPLENIPLHSVNHMFSIGNEPEEQKCCTKICMELKEKWRG